MEIVLEHIGDLPARNVGGVDRYYRLQRKDDDLTPQQAKDWLLPQVYVEGRGAGSHFCHTILAQQVEYSTSTVICIVQNRRDI